RGILHSEWEHELTSGPRVRLRGLRFASQADRSLAVEAILVETDRPVALELETWPGASGPALVREDGDRGGSRWRVAGGLTRLASAQRERLRVGGRALAARHRNGHASWSWVAMPDRPALFWRVVSMARGEDEDLGRPARIHVERALRAGLPRLVDEHARAWTARWAASDVIVNGDEAAQRGLRFALYHLIGAANPDDDRVSIGARALTGDAYRGHVFWDTDTFLLPYFILTWPEAARAMLAYRHRTLPGARAKARRLGYRGALYAWESTDSGDETTPERIVLPDGTVVPVLCGTREHHISADVAYAVWLYWQATGDDRFLREAGAEIVLETARFWASRARLEEDGRYHIRGVIGPDEYHEEVDDSAYTNELARWNLERGVEVARLLAGRWPRRWAALRREIGLEPEELDRWPNVAAGLSVPVDPATGLLDEFAGFLGLEQVDLERYAGRTVPMDVVLGRERTRRSQVVKQADVVMLLALLWDRFPPAVREANFQYYAAHCGHGSSLSPAMHAAVAARLGNPELALRYLHQAIALDANDSMGNADLGVHIGAHGGLWQAIAFGFGGLSLGADGLALDPHLPSGWTSLCFPLSWRGRRLTVALERRSPLAVHVTLERGDPVTVTVGGLSRRVGAGAARDWRFDDAAGAWQADQ
ncbi:MAG TPA: glycosyl hydrolase family 65 protein, partial [Thermomicrobiaceae bacterium]|nr:glycosyl hydrolase family 65 protein [Thermomicrobiaceae bacterium]